MATGSVTATYHGTLPTGTDLNDVVNAGYYWLAGNTTYVGVPENRPYGLLIVEKPADAGGIFQRFIYTWNTSASSRGYIEYRRAKPASGWYPWYKQEYTYVG